MEYFKTLVWKDQEGYALIWEGVGGEEIVWSSVPRLLPTTATIEGLQQLYPLLDLGEIEMVTIKLIENEK